MLLRPYQREAVEAVYDAYNNGITKVLSVLATGSGKTVIAANVIKELPARLNCEGRVLWLTHEENLIDQSAVSVMRVLFPEHATMIPLIVGEAGGVVNFMTANHNLFGNPECATTFHLLKKELGIIKQKLFSIEPKFVVASVQTIVHRLDKIPADHFDMIICDEAHLFLANSFSTVLNYFKPKIRAGYTATAERLDGLSLGDLFDKIVIEKDIKFGIDNGYLCELEAIALRTNVSLDNVKTVMGDLSQKDLRIVDCPERNDQIVAKWNEVAKGRQTIVFCVDVEHAQNMTQAFTQKGVSATFVVADEKVCPDRKERMRQFKSGKITVMMNVMILTAGFDYPDVGCVVCASPTKSKTRYLQSIGRGTRVKSQEFVARFGKNNCIIIDPTDNSKKHALVNTWSLDHGKPYEDQVFIGAEKKASLIYARDSRRKLEHDQLKDERFNLLSLPVVVVDAKSHWYNDDPTENQIGFLKQLGLYVEGNHYTKGQVSELITHSQAFAKDFQFAQRYGYDVSNGMTKGQFAKVKQAVEERLKRESLAVDPRFKNSPFVGLT